MFEHINTKQLEQELIALRREFHRYPESAWTEFRTTARIVEELEKLGLPVRYGASIHAKEKMYGLPTETDCTPEEIAHTALADKKRRGGSITLVVPREIGRCELVKAPVSELAGWAGQRN